ncbi:hypothetical protein EF906_33820, partial [Streptomyces sp. WAC08241]
MPAKDFRVSERRRLQPWGVLALAMLSGLAMMRNGVDAAAGPPQPAAARRRRPRRCASSRVRTA